MNRICYRRMGIFYILIVYYDVLEIKGKVRIKNCFFVFGVSNWINSGNFFLGGEISLGIYLRFFFLREVILYLKGLLYIRVKMLSK